MARLTTNTNEQFAPCLARMLIIIYKQMSQIGINATPTLNYSNTQQAKFN